MRITFRDKLLGLAAVSATALVVIVTVSALSAARVDRQVEAIQRELLPRVGLQPKLEGDLERLQRAFQDAVGSHDRDALDATRARKTELLSDVAAAGAAVSPDVATVVRAEVEQYFASAYDVSKRLIAGETGEDIVEAMRGMQGEQAKCLAIVRAAAALDPEDVTRSFDAVRRAESAAGATRLWMGIGCLVAMLALSLALSRSVLRSVDRLSRGFERFGRGDFSPIEVAARGDELVDLARHANDMAASLKVANQELEAFSYSVAHDLRAPLRGINGFSRVLVEDYGPSLDAEAKQYLDRIMAATERMGNLIDALLSLSRLTRLELRRETVDLARLADGVIAQLRTGQPDRKVDVVVQQGVRTRGDAPLLRALLENLLGNAWKFTGGRDGARIEFGVEPTDDGPAYFVRDNGAGFDMQFAGRLFTPFQRLHSQTEFAGTGIGLATVQRIVHRHGGRIWAESAVDAGATFRFTLGDAERGATTA